MEAERGRGRAEGELVAANKPLSLINFNIRGFI